MTPGRAVYLVRSRFRHGLCTAWYRDAVRPRILDTGPIRTEADGVCEIHVLTSAEDWLNLLWSLKSFYRYSGRRYPLCIHDDGRLTPEQRQTLQRHFPDARLILRSTAEAEVPPALEGYPRCLEFRRKNTLSLKLFDFRHFLRGDRMLLLDCDVLFFHSPDELLRRIEDPLYRKNSVNGDLSSAHTVSPEMVRERFGFELEPLFNSGLGLIHRDSLRLEWIEEFLELPGILGHFWRIEQTLFALCSGRHGGELLPDEYSVHQGPRRRGAPCRHYVGEIRQLMYGEGVRDLLRDGLLREPKEDVPAPAARCPVLMMPDYRADNPYQRLLADALARRGIPVFFPKGYRRVLPFCRAIKDSPERISVLHLHWLSPYLKGGGAVTYALYSVKLYADLFLARVLGVRLVWTIHNEVSHDARFPGIETRLMRRVARLADRTIVHSESARKRLRNVLPAQPGRTIVVPHGHFRSAYGQAVQQAEARHALGLPEQDRVFLCFGLIRRYKSIDTLLRVWKERDAADQHGTLVIAGEPVDPAYAAALRGIAEGSRGVVLKLSRIPDEEVPVFYGAADIVVLPFRRILTSGSALLAMSFSRPVIGPRIDVLSELLGPADDLLYNVDDPSGLRKSLERAGCPRFDLVSLSKRTESRCDELDWDKIAASTAAAYAGGER
jgi:glycosyltransferase involved in cell wall biosynthesis